MIDLHFIELWVWIIGSIIGFTVSMMNLRQSIIDYKWYNTAADLKPHDSNVLWIQVVANVRREVIRSYIQLSYIIIGLYSAATPAPITSGNAVHQFFSFHLIPLLFIFAMLALNYSSLSDARARRKILAELAHR